MRFASSTRQGREGLLYSAQGGCVGRRAGENAEHSGGVNSQQPAQGRRSQRAQSDYRHASALRARPCWRKAAKIFGLTGRNRSSCFDFCARASFVASEVLDEKIGQLFCHCIKG